MATSEKTRLATVQEHVRAENAHDVDAIMGTFGHQSSITVNGLPFAGRDSIRTFYEDRLRTLPGFGFAVQQQHLSADSVIAEHTLSFLDNSGQRVEVPVCIVYCFDETGKLAGERIYFNDALLPAMS